MAAVADVLATALIERGVTTAFGVLGDGNLACTTAFLARDGRVIQARHEGNALAMASSVARLSGVEPGELNGGIGLATVTCGPGLTQTATALATCVRGRFPVIVLAGDVPERPARPRDRVQAMDQHGFTDALGAAFVRVESSESVVRDVARAFELVRAGPVVLSCRSDLQRAPSRSRRPTLSAPDPGVATAPAADEVAALVDRLAASRHPFVLLGRGSIAAAAGASAHELAARVGAPTGTTMPAKGHASDEPWHVGVVGGYGSALVARLGDETDLLVAVGTSISNETLANGRLFPNASLLHISLDPPNAGRRWPDPLAVRADARLTLEAAVRRWDERSLGRRVGRRTPELAGEVAADPAQEAWHDPWPEHPGTVDPRVAIARVGAAAPPDAVFVSAVGHFSALPPRLVRGRPGQRWLMPYDFGAIGQSMSVGVGAAAVSGRTTIVFEGDGGLLMNIQELDTARRVGAPVVVAVINDGALGAEYHQLFRDGQDPTPAVIEPPAFADVARAFGVDSVDVTSLDALSGLAARLSKLSGPLLLDIHVNPEARTRSLRSVGAV